MATSPLEVEALSERVVGGATVAACGWPSTVRVNGATTCTGTLIHPRVVTTAAHCIGGTSATIAFGPPRDPAGFSVRGTCRAGARGESGVSSGDDWAYCVLPDDERIRKLPITPPLVGCEAERFLKPGAHAWIVGYGTTGPSGNGAGVKREVEVVVNALDKLGPGTIDVGDATKGACHGDSGGPIYMQLSDGAQDWGFRVFGSTSGPGTEFGCDCNCSSTYVNIANHVKQIELNEGIDVTPCTDDAGNWQPGPSCAAMPANPRGATGTFPNCTVATTSAPIQTCGPNTAAPQAGSPAAGNSGGGAGIAAAGAAGTSRAGAAAAAAAGSGNAGALSSAGASAVNAGAGALPNAGAPVATLPAAGTLASAGTLAPVVAAGGGAGQVGSTGFGITASAGSGAASTAIAGSYAMTPAATQPAAPAEPSGCQCSALGVSRPHREGTAGAWLALALCSGLALRVRRSRG